MALKATGHSAMISGEVFAKDTETAGAERTTKRCTYSILRCQEVDDSSQFSRALREAIGDVLALRGEKGTYEEGCKSLLRLSHGGKTKTTKSGGVAYDTR
jgi:hypothetical protein